MGKLIVICSWCGSDRVSNEGTYSWDVDKQEWIASGDPWGDFWCGDCADDCSIRELDVDELRKEPIGTRRVIMVGCAEAWADECVRLTTATGEDVYLLGTEAQLEASDVLVLEKVTLWQWKIVENAEVSAHA